MIVTHQYKCRLIKLIHFHGFIFCDDDDEVYDDDGDDDFSTQLKLKQNFNLIKPKKEVLIPRFLINAFSLNILIINKKL